MDKLDKDRMYLYCMFAYLDNGLIAEKYTIKDRNNQVFLNTKVINKLEPDKQIQVKYIYEVTTKLYRLLAQYKTFKPKIINKLISTLESYLIDIYEELGSKDIVPIYLGCTGLVLYQEGVTHKTIKPSISYKKLSTIINNIDEEYTDTLVVELDRSGEVVSRLLERVYND